MPQRGFKQIIVLPLVWGTVFGGIGFVCGFFGPMMFSPGANQGPLLGIFITGPISAIIGAVVGLIVVFLPISTQTSFYSMVIGSISIAGISLYMSMPQPKYLGLVVDAEIRGCKSPKIVSDAAITRWEKLNAETTWRTPREGWKEDVERMVNEDQGVVLEMFVFREQDILEKRKPWNKGTLKASAWETKNTLIDYYARNGGTSCANYKMNTRSLYFPKWETSKVSPPSVLPSFLGLSVIEPVPDEYRNLVSN